MEFLTCQYFVQLLMKKIDNFKLIFMTNFKETVRSLAAYFEEVKSLKEAGLDLIKFDAHNSLYKMLLERLVETYGYNEMIAVLKYADENKTTDRDLEILYDLLHPSDKYTRPVMDGEEKDAPCKAEDVPCEKECVKEYEKPSFTAKFFINDEEVTEADFNKATKAMMERREKFVPEAWLLKNIFGF